MTKKNQSCGTTQITLNPQNTQRAAEWKLAEDAKEETFRSWAARLVKTRSRILQVNQQYKKLMADFLGEAYSVFAEVEGSEHAEEFYESIRWQLKSNGAKIQKNTPNAGLIVRLVCGDEISTKSMSDYSRVLEGASHNNIKPAEFVEWVKSKTMTAIIDEQRKLSSNVDTYEDRLQRARIVALRVLETREVRPILSQTTTSWAAEKLIGRDGLWIAIGNAKRRPDRDSFNADINLLAMLTPNIDLEVYVINYIAKAFVSDVQRYEKMINEMEESVWADKLWEMMISSGEEKSAK
jgi:hypothetical protein